MKTYVPSTYMRNQTTYDKVGYIFSLIAIACIAVLSGCSHEVAVTYNSEPSGATIYQEGIGTLGVAPVTVKYNYDDVKVQNGKIYTGRMKAVWVSGATLLMQPTAIALGPDDHAVYTFNRPQDVATPVSEDGNGRDQRYAIARENKLEAPATVYLATAHQRRGFFDALNTGITCLYSGVTANPYAVCD